MVGKKRRSFRTSFVMAAGFICLSSLLVAGGGVDSLDEARDAVRSAVISYDATLIAVQGANWERRTRVINAGVALAFSGEQGATQIESVLTISVNFKSGTLSANRMTRDATSGEIKPAPLLGRKLANPILTRLGSAIPILMNAIDGVINAATSTGAGDEEDLLGSLPADEGSDAVQSRNLSAALEKLKEMLRQNRPSDKNRLVLILDGAGDKLLAEVYGVNRGGLSGNDESRPQLDIESQFEELVRQITGTEFEPGLRASVILSDNNHISGLKLGQVVYPVLVGKPTLSEISGLIRKKLRSLGVANEQITDRDISTLAAELVGLGEDEIHTCLALRGSQMKSGFDDLRGYSGSPDERVRVLRKGIGADLRKVRESFLAGKGKDSTIGVEFIPLDEIPGRINGDSIGLEEYEKHIKALMEGHLTEEQRAALANSEHGNVIALTATNKGRVLLLEGAHGNGKTVGAYKTAINLGVPLWKLTLPDSPFIGTAVQQLNESLSLIRESRGDCVIFIDEVEKIFANVDNQNAGTFSDMLNIRAQLLTVLADFIAEVNTPSWTNRGGGRVTFVLAGNETYYLTERLKSRITMRFFFDYPVAAVRQEIIRIFFDERGAFSSKNVPVYRRMYPEMANVTDEELLAHAKSKIATKRLVEMTYGYSGRELMMILDLTTGEILKAEKSCYEAIKNNKPAPAFSLESIILGVIKQKTQRGMFAMSEVYRKIMEGAGGQSFQAGKSILQEVPSVDLVKEHPDLLKQWLALQDVQLAANLIKPDEVSAAREEARKIHGALPLPDENIRNIVEAAREASTCRPGPDLDPAHIPPRPRGSSGSHLKRTPARRPPNSSSGGEAPSSSGGDE